MRLSTSTVRGSLTREQFTRVIQMGSTRSHMDAAKLPYEASLLFNDQYPFKFSYNMDKRMLTMRAIYRVYRTDSDGVQFDI